MVKGLLGEKEKVEQLVDKSMGFVDKCLLTNAPLQTSLTAYPCKDCVLQAFWMICAKKAQRCAILRLLIAAYAAGLARDKGRVLGFVRKFLSITG